MRRTTGRLYSFAPSSLPFRGIGDCLLLSFLHHRRNLRIAASAAETFAARNSAIYAIAEAADARSVAVLRRIAAGPDDLNLRRSAIGRLAAIRSPQSLRALLALAADASTSNSWVLSDALGGLSWNTIGLQALGEEAVPPLLAAAGGVLRWPRRTGGERILQAGVFREIEAMLEKLTAPGASRARRILHDRLQERRAEELPDLVKAAMENGAFEEVESALAEIAGLGTPAALAALARIRAAPERTLHHHVEMDNPEVESGYSPRLVTIPRSSAELGETLKGEALARWRGAARR